MEKISNIERRNNSNKKIKQLGIACLETLPVIEDSTQVSLKDIDTICKRAIACLISTQLAIDISENNDYDSSKTFFLNMLKQYGVQDNLIEKEKRIFNGKYSKQDVIDVVWSYEAYWSLVWTLGLVENIDYPNQICDCEKAIMLVSTCKTYDDFKCKCKIRDIEENLDMLDLYYRYDWAVTEKRINPDTLIADLNPDVVVERRKGLEWLIANEEDWDEISLDT